MAVNELITRRSQVQILPPPPTKVIVTEAPDFLGGFGLFGLGYRETSIPRLARINIDSCLGIRVVTRVVEKSWCSGNGSSCGCCVQTDQYMIIRVIIG